MLSALKGWVVNFYTLHFRLNVDNQLVFAIFRFVRTAKRCGKTDDWIKRETCRTLARNRSDRVRRLQPMIDTWVIDASIVDASDSAVIRYLLATQATEQRKKEATR